jgi:hypothetical protein
MIVPALRWADSDNRFMTRTSTSANISQGISVRAMRTPGTGWNISVLHAVPSRSVNLPLFSTLVSKYFSVRGGISMPSGK